MLIAIPTFGRALNQRTWASIPHSLRGDTFLFVQSQEKERYLSYVKNLVVLPPEIKDIATTRDYIISYAHTFEDVVIMCDDDLDFAVRRQDDPTRFREANEDDIEDMFLHLSIALKTYAHAGVSPREGANRNIENWLFNTRMLRVIGYQPEVLLKHKIKFSDVQFMEDFHVNLSLLERGYVGALCNMYVNNQPGSQIAGGCSGQRTPENQHAAALRLAELHPGFVTVVRKTTKTSWGGRGRTDVRIAWKKAYESSGSNTTPELLDRGTGNDTPKEGSQSTETVE
jgi:hypothetical protein